MHKIKKKPYMWFTIVQYCTLDTVKFKASALKIDQGSITDVPRTDEIQLPQQQLPQLHLPQQQLSQTTPNYPSNNYLSNNYPATTTPATTETMGSPAKLQFL